MKMDMDDNINTNIFVSPGTPILILMLIGSLLEHHLTLFV